MKTGFIAEGTTCDACATIIKKQATKVNGVTDVTFDYATETGFVTFDENLTNIDEILDKIEDKGYSCFILDENNQDNSMKKTIGWIAGIAGILLVGYFLLNMAGGISLPQISQNMGLGLLFIVGLLTGFHCISMCGGFVVSYTAKAASDGSPTRISHLSYGLGKTLSYTFFGAVFGLLGSIIAFTPQMRGVSGILAGVFLVVFGLNMLNVFPFLRKIRIRLPAKLSRMVGRGQNSSPLVIGLLNGLMIACGPLQAIYIMAAGTGSLVEGAKMLLAFGLGTLPVMLGFGYVTSFISKTATTKILKASGVIVMVLGLIMINRGLALTGTGFTVYQDSENMQLGSAIEEGYQTIEMDVTRYGWEPDRFVLKKDVPVKWKINGLEINGCNNAIQVPEYGLEFDIQQGEQVIEFTPKEAGTVRWSCWMGMIPGAFVVKEDIDLADVELIQQELDTVPKQPRGSCGGSCGSSTCGAATGGSCGCGGR